MVSKMAKENFRDADFREQFRPDPSQIYIYDLPKEMKDPLRDYRRVRVSYRNKPYHIYDAEKKGWEFVLMEGQAKTSKLNANTEKDNIRPEPIKVVARDGTISYWMSILKTRNQENRKDARLAREAVLNRSIDIKNSRKTSQQKDMDIIEPDL